MNSEIRIHVHLNSKQYRRFCAFDIFKRQRRWFVPVLTSMIVFTLAGAYTLLSKNQSGTVAGLLVGLGLAVPMFSFGMYLIQIEAQIAQLRLRQNPEIYWLHFREENVLAGSPGQSKPSAEIPWDQFWAAYRRKDASYLFFNQARAFILPDGQAENNVSGEQLFDYLRAHMPQDRCF